MWIESVPAGSIDPENGSPLHAQLSALLRRGIADGSLPPGAQLPTEAALQQAFGISRSVVRQAMAGLAGDGLILRGRGRGSVVAPRHEHHRHVQRLTGLSAQISAAATSVRTEVLSIGPGTDPRATKAIGTNSLIALRRRRYADGEAIAVIQTWLAQSLAGALTAAELTDASLHAILADKFDAPVAAGQRQIRAVAASALLADELWVEEGSPLLLLEGTSVDASGRPIEYFSTWHRADRVVFDIDTRSDAVDGPSSAALASRVQELALELQALSARLSA